MSGEPKLDAAKRPSGLRSMAGGLIYEAGRTGVETANVWRTADILRSAADEIELLRKQRDEAREMHLKALRERESAEREGDAMLERAIKAERERDEALELFNKLKEETK